MDHEIHDLKQAQEAQAARLAAIERNMHELQLWKARREAEREHFDSRINAVEKHIDTVREGLEKRHDKTDALMTRIAWTIIGPVALAIVATILNGGKLPVP